MKNQQQLQKLIYEMNNKLISKYGPEFSDLEINWGNRIPRTGSGAVCQVGKNGYSYRIYERGNLLKEVTTEDVNEIIYAIFSNHLHEAACKYELKNRIKGQDFRRILFEKYLEYWRALGDDYYNFASSKIDAILREFPYSD